MMSYHMHTYVRLRTGYVHVRPTTGIQQYEYTAVRIYIKVYSYTSRTRRKNTQPPCMAVSNALTLLVLLRSPCAWQISVSRYLATAGAP